MMTPDAARMDEDAVFARLAELPVAPVGTALSQTIRERALPLLEPRRLHPLWALVVAASTVGYLGCALRFALRLF